jgi:hypothetical protein
MASIFGLRTGKLRTDLRWHAPLTGWRAPLTAVLALTLPLLSPGVPMAGVGYHPRPVARGDVGSYQPAFPIKGTFIYLWQQNLTHDGVWRYWDDGTLADGRPPLAWNSRSLPDIDPAVFDPATELYSGQDEAAQRWIIAQLTRARMDLAISSWWGRGHRTDTALEKLFDVLEGPDSPDPLLRVAAYYEMEGSTDPSTRRIKRDLRYLRERYADRPSYLRIDGRPVIFVYGVDEEGLDMPRRWEVAQRAGFFTVLRVFGYGLYRFGPHQPDAWHDYRPAIRTTRTSDAISVSPGFFSVTEPEPRLERDPAAFAAASRRALMEARARGQRFVLWTTGNEDGEGTGYFPQTTVIRAGAESSPHPDSGPSDREVAILERILPPLPEIVFDQNA